MAGLTILPDIADWVGSRVRSRVPTKITLIGPVVPVLAFIWFYVDVRSWGRADQAGTFLWPTMLLAVTALAATASAVAHLEERRSAERSGEPIADAALGRQLPACPPVCRPSGRW